MYYCPFRDTFFSQMSGVRCIGKEKLSFGYQHTLVPWLGWVKSRDIFYLFRVLSSVEWLKTRPQHSAVNCNSLKFPGLSHSFAKQSVSFLGFCTSLRLSSRPIGGDNYDRYLPMSSPTSCHPQPSCLKIKFWVVFFNSFLPINKTGNICRRHNKITTSHVYSKLSTTILACLKSVKSLHSMFLKPENDGTIEFKYHIKPMTETT